MPDNSTLTIIRHYFLKLKSFLFSKNALSFLLFLVLSAAFWFVNAFDKERELKTNIPISYIGIPKQVIITNKLPEFISVTVKDEGVNLFSYSTDKLKPLLINLKRNYNQRGEIYITSDQLYNLLEKTLLPTTKILNVKPDSILVNYEKLSERILPIELISRIKLVPQYMLSNKIQLNPSYVKVFGKKNVIDKLTKVQTELLEVNELNDTITKICNLKPIQSVVFDQYSVKVNLFVEMFTEKTIEIPIKTINCPSYLYVRTFPSIVKATFNIGVSYFKFLKNNDLQILLNYNDLRITKSGKHKLTILNNSTLISNVRITPDEVEYILEE